MSRIFLSQDRMNGFRDGRIPGPPFVKVGRNILYLKDDLEAWLEQHRVHRTGDVNDR
ncbi:MAG: helix-turn-helix domain-containing protein [Gammaproteobacteria bacterium]|nr:helix-turn-helix domain-containing protein [Gammaproteobacteria bacterium]